MDHATLSDWQMLNALFSRNSLLGGAHLKPPTPPHGPEEEFFCLPHLFDALIRREKKGLKVP